MFHRVQAKKSRRRARACSWSARAAFRRRSTCCAAAPSRSTSRSRSSIRPGVDETLSTARSALLLQYPDDRGGVRRSAAGHRARARRGRARGGRDRPPGADAAHAAGRDGRRRGRRQLAAVRRAARLRRPARGVLRHARGLRAAGARAHHRRLGRRARPPGLPHGAPDARAAHPPREGDVEHLHGAGAARQHRGDVCRCITARRACARSRRAFTARRRRRARADAARLPADQRALLRHAAHRRRATPRAVATAAPRRRGINFRYVDDGAIGIALDETVVRRATSRTSSRCSREATGSKARRRSASRRPRGALPAALAAHARVPRRTRCSTRTTPRRR